MFGSPVLITAGVAAAALIGGLVIYILKRPTPAERERRRRLKIHREGRITDGTIFDVGEPAEVSGPESAHLLYYNYSIGGVDYSACQDVSTLTDQISIDPATLIGAVYVKYHAKNPYNSIIVCEGWSGLRKSRRAAKKPEPLTASDSGARAQKESEPPAKKESEPCA